MTDTMKVLASRAWDVRLPDGVVVTVDPISDVLYISFRQGMITRTVEDREGILIDFGDRGNVIGISVIHPKRVSLARRKIFKRIASKHYLPALAAIQPEHFARGYTPQADHLAHA